MKTDENGNPIEDEETTETTEETEETETAEGGEETEATEEGDRSVNVTLNDDQFERMFGGAVKAAKQSTKTKRSKATTQKVPTIKSTPSARGIRQTDDHVGAGQKRAHEDKIIATYFGGLANRKAGMGQKGEDMIKRAADMEQEYLQRDTRAMSVGTDSTGGYLSPEIFDTRVIEQLERFGVARQNATIINMTTEVLKMPRMTADVTAYDVAEAAQITASQPTLEQMTLNPRKQAVMAGPLSDELFINADPAIVPILIDSSARALAKLEDNHVFVGASANFTGLLEGTTNEVAQAAGTTYAGVTLEDIVNLVDEVEDHLITEGSKFYWNKKVTGALRKDKGADNYHWGAPSAGAPRSLYDYPVTHVSQMPATATTDTNYGVFGDLRNVYLGIRGGLRVDLLTEGTVNSVNLGETAQYAVRVMEYFDSEVANPEAFALLKTA